MIVDETHDVADSLEGIRLRVVPRKRSEADPQGVFFLDLAIDEKITCQLARSRFGRDPGPRTRIGLEAGPLKDVHVAFDDVRQLIRSIGAHGAAGARGGENSDDEDLVRQLVLMAYPDRVCRRRASDPRAALMTGGTGIRLDPSSAVQQGEYFVALDPRQDDRSRQREATVRIASRIEPGWLEDFFPQSIHRLRTPRYDEDRQRVVVTEETRYEDLVLRQETQTNLPRELSGELLAEALKEQLPDMLESEERLAALVRRLRFAQRHFPDQPWPTIDQSMLIEACHGQHSRAGAVASLAQAIHHRLVYPLDRILEEHVPETYTVPTGSQIRLQYQADPEQPPVLAVRLQEVFGLSETPRIAKGRVAVLLHLLGPNYRPVQITRDLASFWATTYAQVRKDLRADYPKHSWPDDPLTAEAVRGARRRR